MLLTQEEMVTSALVFQAPRIIRETACLLRSFGTKIFPIRHKFELSTLSFVPSSSSMVKESIGACVVSAIEKRSKGVRLKRLYKGGLKKKRFEVLDEEPGDDEKGGSQSYVLKFDDDEEEDRSLPQRIVPFHRIVGLPEGHHQ
ncbi:hypothetical protein LOK49_LG04G03599 [Camellia lanceoleosa]|uniref:Uncharacterized protein n=1 Tax=Camellia lanceoleosa TaxID=1840588 RepID=A0ACC0I0W6_9ERIC|nr:hypothetical protein LOK49_LG04G03599 [Camellia lanceoleosa]